MDYYYHEFEKKQEEFEEILHKYPLFQEMLDDLYEHDIKEINEFLEKNDEFYLKKALSKLDDIIKYIKDTSMSIDKEYEKFDLYAKTWEQMNFDEFNQKELDKLNIKIEKANELIQSHDLKKIKEANKIMESLINE